MAIYLITTQEIKTNTPMGGNVDSDRLMSLIYDAQVLLLEPILGTKLYDYIIANYDTPLTGLYLQMYTDYIKPILWHSVYADYLRTGNVLASNGGIYTNQPENANISDVESIKYSVKHYQSKADSYIDRLDRFLCDKEDEIAEYTPTQDNDYDIKPDSNINTISGWFFGNERIDNSNTTGAGGNGEEYLELE